MLNQDFWMVWLVLKVCFIQQLKFYMIWVQTRVIQVGFHLLYNFPSKKGQEK